MEIKSNTKINDSNILLSSSSVGFRSKFFYGTRYIPFRLKLFPLKKTPWILHTYNDKSTRVYGTGFSILDFLIFLEKDTLDIDSYTHFIGSFGIVEGWNRNKIYDSDNIKSNGWNAIIDRLLEKSNVEYQKDLKKWIKDVTSDNLTKTMLSLELWEKYLILVLKKLHNIKNKVFIVLSHELTKKYTHSDIQKFNEVIFKLQNSYDFDIIYLTKEEGFDTYDATHLTMASHNKLIGKIEDYLGFKYDRIGFLNQAYIRLKEYIAFYKK